MRKLTPEGEQVIQELAKRHGISVEAVMNMLQAMVAGNGSMAQFNHPEFGGSGQWMMGGMTMVGDMFNYGLKATVDNLCSEMSGLLANQSTTLTPGSSQTQFQGGGGQQQGGGGQQQQQGGSGPYIGVGGQAVSIFVPPAPGDSGEWWPADLGAPAATGAQNQVRYAYFADKCRLAIEIHGKVTVYDTADHQIGGVSQQQGTGGSITFTSQHGVVRVADLRNIADAPAKEDPADTASAKEDQAGTAAASDSDSDSAPTATPAAAPVHAPEVQPSAPVPVQAPVEQPSDAMTNSSAEILATIEKLAELKEKGIVTEEEFAAKKKQLLDSL